MTIGILYEVDDCTAARLWDLYRQTFAPLATRAALRHVLRWDEFLSQMRDPRVGKYVWRGRDGRPAGLGTLARDLSAIPDVSPDYYIARWPRAYAEGRLFYIGYLMVHPDHEDTDAFAHLVLAIVRTVAQAGGVLGFDMCLFNQQTRQLVDRMIAVVGEEEIDHFTAVDVQTFYAITFSDTAGAGSLPSGLDRAAG